MGMSSHPAFGNRNCSTFVDKTPSGTSSRSMSLACESLLFSNLLSTIMFREIRNLHRRKYRPNTPGKLRISRMLKKRPFRRWPTITNLSTLSFFSLFNRPESKIFLNFQISEIIGFDRTSCSIIYRLSTNMAKYSIVKTDEFPMIHTNQLLPLFILRNYTHELIFTFQ